MKFLAVLSLFILALGCNASSEPTKKSEAVVKAETKGEAVKEEDCDDKAKKVIEIKEETISLTGNAGCTLDEVK